MEGIWDGEIIPALTDYIRIPNKSPAFDPDWEKHGHMDQVVEMFTAWAKAKLVQFPGATLEVVRLPGRTPLILIEVPGKAAGTDLDVRPSRQAAGDEGLGRRHRAVDAGAEGRQAVSAAAAPMTAMPCSPPSARCWR